MPKLSRKELLRASLQKLGYPGSVNDFKSIQDHLTKIITRVNDIIVCVSGLSSTERLAERQSGIIGQIKLKELNEGQYTLECFTKRGWKEAKVVDIVDENGELRFE